MAVVTLLAMRGAVAFRTAYWLGLNNEMYMTLYQTTASVQTPFSGDWEVVINRMKDFLQLGADPNFDGLTDPYFDRVVLLEVALRSGNGAVVKLVLDAGARLPVGVSNMDQFFDTVVAYCWTPAAASDKETTMRLLAPVTKFVKTLHDNHQWRRRCDRTIDDWAVESTTYGRKPPGWIRDALDNLRSANARRL